MDAVTADLNKYLAQQEHQEQYEAAFENFFSEFMGDNPGLSDFFESGYCDSATEENISDFVEEHFKKHLQTCEEKGYDI